SWLNAAATSRAMASSRAIARPWRCFFRDVCAFAFAKRRNAYGSKIFRERLQGRRARHAREEARHAQKRQRRQGRQGQEPQAGHRHRPFGSAQEGQEGSQEKEWRQEEEIGRPQEEKLLSP